MKRPSIVYFVGAGPGDAKLITVKGASLLKKADIVVYAGSLVSEKTLGYCRARPKVFNSASMTLPEITSVMIEGARARKRVVRLHTGDPSIYGALREQTDALDAKGVPYRIVPGVSSAFASAAFLKKGLTAAGGTQTVIFTRLGKRTRVPAAEALPALARHKATICVFLSVERIDRVVSELKKGYAEKTPVAVVCRASWEDERAVTGTLKDIAEKVKAAGMTKHALIIAGDALSASPSALKSRLYDADFKHGCRG